ncbi:LytTR family DNA-binding domain-containing protein [Chryseobacterium sp. BIGb0232]|uniref:LytR/AlgR family response regulator transcription factor n=1 Tax=Chryseobacterium sp. BIGb0232 TaxID=2940598 RepID=UPI000F4808AB|nr:LytTR family DNA-binding domain-containing protein [Chryseobacterium sp. BIGb0232]MCS4303660.1 DNA-binding LytR/AlgR family response regulator [Chryseobacterium sp. BIGb0232]ROS10358.1 LytTR family two component transcriptional regulator [Chryseobacterium nakagawai]
MNKIKCIIVDDEPLAISLLEQYVQKIPFLELVFSTENPIEALEYIQNNDSDLIFLDIQMPELTGINFMKIVGAKQKYILTTAYSEYALEGYEHNIVDYLLKPVSFERFLKSAMKAQERFSFQEEDAHFFVKSSGQQHRINFNEILYIESIKDYVNIRTAGEEYIVLDTLKSMENQLSESFVRIHKSFIVNLDKVKSIGAKKVILPEMEIPIGDSYRANLLDRLK